MRVRLASDVSMSFPSLGRFNSLIGFSDCFLFLTLVVPPLILKLLDDSVGLFKFKQSFVFCFFFPKLARGSSQFKSACCSTAPPEAPLSPTF